MTTPLQRSTLSKSNAVITHTYIQRSTHAQHMCVSICEYARVGPGAHVGAILRARCAAHGGRAGRFCMRSARWRSKVRLHPGGPKGHKEATERDTLDTRVPNGLQAHEVHDFQTEGCILMSLGLPLGGPLVGDCSRDVCPQHRAIRSEAFQRNCFLYFYLSGSAGQI